MVSPPPAVACSRLTLRCTRLATAGFARFRERVNSNVRTLLSGLAVSQPTWLALFVGSYAAWVVWGFLWLFPRKMRMLRRYPGATNDDLIRLAKAGNVEAQQIRRDTRVFIAIGLLLGALFGLARLAIVTK